jgi:hypothetical protein
MASAVANLILVVGAYLTQNSATAIRAAPDGPNVCETHASTTHVSRDVPSAAWSTQMVLTGLDPQRT